MKWPSPWFSHSACGVSDHGFSGSVAMLGSELVLVSFSLKGFLKVQGGNYLASQPPQQAQHYQHTADNLF